MARFEFGFWCMCWHYHLFWYIGTELVPLFNREFFDEVGGVSFRVVFKRKRKILRLCWRGLPPWKIFCGLMWTFGSYIVRFYWNYLDLFPSLWSVHALRRLVAIHGRLTGLKNFQKSQMPLALEVPLTDNI